MCCATTARVARGWPGSTCTPASARTATASASSPAATTTTAYARAKAWWGPVTSIYNGSSTSALLTGMMFEAAYDECAQAEYTGIALEYGTLPQAEVMLALRADQWLENHPEADDATRRAIKQQVRDAFYTDTDEWKDRIVAQAVDASYGAVRGLVAQRLPEAAVTAATAGPCDRGIARRGRRARGDERGASHRNARGDDPRLEPRLHRRLGRQRRPACHRAQPRCRRRLDLVADQRLPAAARRARAVRRRRRRSLGPQAHLSRRPARVRDRIDRLCPGAELRPPAGRPRRARTGCGLPHAGEPGPARRGLQRRGARPRRRHLGGGRCRHRRHRPAPRRLAHRRARLAIDLPHQRADRRWPPALWPGPTSTRAEAATPAPLDLGGALLATAGLALADRGPHRACRLGWRGCGSGRDTGRAQRQRRLRRWPRAARCCSPSSASRPGSAPGR